jgi:hypothetical protein
MICTRCQTPSEPDSAFCANCGQSLQGAAAVPGPKAAGTPGPQSSVGKRPTGEAFRFDLHRLGRTELVVGGASLVVLISLFLPWYGFSVLGANYSVNGVTSHGYLYIVLLLTLAILAYLMLRAGWDQSPLALPIAHGPLLLIGTAIQLLLVFIAFLDKPIPQLSWDFGAWITLIAAVTAAVPVITPAVRAWQTNR